MTTYAQLKNSFLTHLPSGEVKYGSSYVEEI